MPPLNTTAPLGPRLARGKSLAPILIQVPSLPASPRRHSSIAPTSRPRRRRLKRGVRLAGFAFLMAVPMPWAAPLAFRAVTGAVASESTRSAATSAAATLAAFEPPPVVSLRLEADSPGVGASTEAPARETRSPVALRGDILPDDGSMEGSAHAGS